MIEALVISVVFRTLDLIITRLEARASKDKEGLAKLRNRRDELWAEIEALRKRR